jgi:predicted acylesterase/phospholipase RssA
MNLDQQRLCIELQHLDWAHQLKEEVIQDLAASAKLVEFQAGQVVIELDSEIDSLYFVVAGRLEGALFDRLGKQIVSDTFQRGSVVGLFSVLLRMDQLVIPVTTIAADLVDGVALARDTGDATRNILESINLPPLSLPIVQLEQAVVDGGLLNNVPANVLVAKGCNFVIASTVTATIEKDFMGIRSKRHRGVSRFIATIQVIMRQHMIQSHRMNAVGVEPADFVIAPDVTSFDLSEFTRADEMAVVGVDHQRDGPSTQGDAVQTRPAIVCLEIDLKFGRLEPSHCAGAGSFIPVP